jgi:hypothetical protein
VTHRDCLRLGLGALICGGLVDGFRLRGEAALAASRPTSCILIWTDGGPSHYETFDPKPDAPKELRGEFSPIATSVPGIYFSEPMKRSLASSPVVRAAPSMLRILQLLRLRRFIVLRASVDDTDARREARRCFGRSDRSAQGDRPTLRSIRPKRATRPFDASVDPTEARKDAGHAQAVGGTELGRS